MIVLSQLMIYPIKSRRSTWWMIGAWNEPGWKLTVEVLE